MRANDRGEQVSTSESYQEQNRASLQRMRQVLERLSDADLTRVLPSGWSVSDTLGHVAFYDRRAAILLERFGTEGVFASDGDVDTTNAIIPYLTRRIPPQAMVAEAIEAAEAADQAVAALPVSLMSEVDRANVVRLSRAEHRDEHLEEIEAALT